MQVHGFWPIFGLGCLGGILIELLRWWHLREALDLPVIKHWYWWITILMVLAGGGLAVLYGLGPVNALMVVNIGAAAPSIISTLAAAPPTKPGDPTAMKPFGPPTELSHGKAILTILSMNRR